MSYLAESDGPASRPDPGSANAWLGDLKRVSTWPLQGLAASLCKWAGGVSIVGEAALPERCPCDRGGTVAASPLGWGLGRNPLRHSRNAVPLAWIRQL